MKRAIEIIFLSIVVLAFLYSAIFVFMMFRGKDIILKRIADLTQRNVSLGYFDLTMPLNLELRNLNIEGLARVDKIFISPSIPYFFTGNIALNNVRIIKPQITLERNFPEIEALKATTQAARQSQPSQAAAKSSIKLPLRLIIKHLTITDGKINFIDHTPGPEGIRITAEDINFNIINLYMFPFSTITNFELKGTIPWQQGQERGKIDAEGWLNLYKKDMEASFKITGIDGTYLYPYYSNWVDLEKANIEKATLSFTGNVHSLRNNLTAECRLELTNIVRRPPASEQVQEKAEKITDTVLDIFKALDQGKIVLDFTIRTKMDRPEFGFGNIKVAFEDKIAQGMAGSGFKTQDVFKLPLRLLEGGVKGMTDLTKTVIGGTFAIGTELKRAVEDTFRKAPRIPEKKE